VLLKCSDGCKLEQFETSQHSGRSVWKVLIVQTDDALDRRGSRRYDTSSGWLALWTDGRPDRMFSSSGRMLLTEERPEGIPRRPDGCKGIELTDLNSAQSILEAHN
jgi:hypothetical protein